MNKKTKITLKVFALVIILTIIIAFAVYLYQSKISIIDAVLHPFPESEPVIQLDKKTFKLGENIEYSVINRTNKAIRPEIASPHIEESKDNSWERVEKRVCPCGSYCMVGPARAFSPREKRAYQWDQLDKTCTGKYLEKESREQVSPGKYRLVFEYSFNTNYRDYGPSEAPLYSEFDIVPDGSLTYVEYKIEFNKTSFKKGEVVEYSITNNSQEDLDSWLNIEKFVNGNWEKIKSADICDCEAATCSKKALPLLKPGEKRFAKWDQRETWCKGQLKSEQAPPGKYRIVLGSVSSEFELLP